MIKVKVKSIGADSFSGSPILLLENIENSNEIFPIWIGIPEAESIIMHQAGIITPRPLTYDLMKSIIENLGAVVKYVAIIDKKDNIYIAEITLERAGKEIKIDSRPSDAVNIALRFNVPIYLNEKVVQSVSLKDIKQVNENEDNQKGKKIIDEQVQKDLEDAIDGLKRITENLLKNKSKGKVEKNVKANVEKGSKTDKSKGYSEEDEIKKFLENVKPSDFEVKPKRNKKG